MLLIATAHPPFPNIPTPVRAWLMSFDGVPIDGGGGNASNGTGSATVGDHVVTDYLYARCLPLAVLLAV